MLGQINVCFVWHMHQPFYKDLLSGEYKLPWTRMHALKDYYGMVKILDEFPGIHQTFNLVPSMLVQIAEYAEGRAIDPFLRLALTPAEDLSGQEREFILRYFFQANRKMIERHPRYAELFHIRQLANSNPQLAARHFDGQMIRDLQVLSQLAWFDEIHLGGDREIAELVAKQRGYTLEDQSTIGRKQREACLRVIPVYKEFAGRQQIELSTSPFYHPILPLLCDSSIASVAQPYVPLPGAFSYPQDAAMQLRRAREYFERELRCSPAGLWPSEGSVSDEVLALAVAEGFNWIATDNTVLGRTLSEHTEPAVTDQPFLWEQNGKRIHVLFRDHFLSDLIGFVYSRMDARQAADHFLSQIRAKCAPTVKQGRDALVPIILDGENAWEYYDRSGRPFLHYLYSLISNEPGMSATTITEALARVPAQPLDHIFPGSWVNANFDIWIGAEEDNQAWEYLLAARRTYERVISSPAVHTLAPENIDLAREELLISEGSDWCWWYGPEHTSENRIEFDELFRSHLANIYRFLGQRVPAELSRPIISPHSPGEQESPTASIQAVIDGNVTSYFEWLGAGLFRVDYGSGAMHSQRSLIKELRYGADGRNIYLRLDFTEPIARQQEMEFRLQLRNAAGAQFEVRHLWRNGRLELASTDMHEGAVTAALGTIYEASVSMNGLDVRYGEPVWLSLSMFRDGLPVAVAPEGGELQVETREAVACAF